VVGSINGGMSGNRESSGGARATGGTHNEKRRGNVVLCSTASVKRNESQQRRVHSVVLVPVTNPDDLKPKVRDNRGAFEVRLRPRLRHFMPQRCFTAGR